MYKILIVDDEEIEREGMAQFIDWGQFGVVLQGTAQNGVEALEIIEKEQPDIVLTDIKMPVMDGLELIQKGKERFPQIQFIVLSGYGEYEFTSQAMEQGVRHYVLKPCDEEQIGAILDKVKQEIEEQKFQQKGSSYYKEAEQLITKAKKQIFRDMLLDPDYMKNSPEENVWKDLGDVILLCFQTEKGFDYLEQFIIVNILIELLGEENVYLSTTESGILYFLLGMEPGQIEKAAQRIIKEFKKLRTDAVFCAMSRNDDVRNVRMLYQETEKLLKMGMAEERDGVITCDVLRKKTEISKNLIDYDSICSAGDFADILFQVYLTFMKMRLNQYTFEQKKEVAEWTLEILCGSKNRLEPDDTGSEETEWKLLEITVESIASFMGKNLGKDKEERRVKSILFAMFRNIQNQELSIRYLSKEELFINEDYLGRIFMRNRKQKFSTFLLKQRIGLAQEIIRYSTELRISQVAELVGYSPDGQYFSKAFKKVTGRSPTEYKEAFLKSRNFTNE